MRMTKDGMGTILEWIGKGERYVSTRSQKNGKLEEIESKAEGTVKCELPLSCRALLSALDGHGLWLNYILLNVSLPSACDIFRNGFSGSQMDSLSGATAGRFVFVFVLMGWSLLPNALRPFQDLLCSPN